MPSKEKSPVWNYFAIAESRAQCGICGLVLTTVIEEFRASNLEKHLRTRHRGSDALVQFEVEKKAWESRQVGGDAPAVRLERRLLAKRDGLVRQVRVTVGSAEERRERRRATNRAAQQRHRARLREAGVANGNAENDVTHVEPTNMAVAYAVSYTEPQSSMVQKAEERLQQQQQLFKQRFLDKLAPDPILSRLLDDRTLEAVLETSATSSDANANPIGQDLRELIFPAVGHPFYNIPRMLALKLSDINALHCTSGQEAILSDRVILFYLTYLAELSRIAPVRSVAVVSPQFTAFNSYAAKQSARPTMTGARSDFEYMLIPICRNRQWMLAIYDAVLGEAPIVCYFDPLQRPLTAEIRNVIETALSTSAEDGPLHASIESAQPPIYNRKIDVGNCGVHICQFAELYLLHYRETSFSNLGLDDFRSRILAACTFIRDVTLLPTVPVDERRHEYTPADIPERGITITDDCPERHTVLTQRLRTLGGCTARDYSSTKLKIECSKEGLFSSEHRLRVSTPKGDIYHKFWGTEELERAVAVLSLINPSEIELHILAEHDFLGLSKGVRVLESVQTQFPHSKVGVRVNFFAGSSSSQYLFLREAGWHHLYEKCRRIASFEISFFYTFDFWNEHKCPKEAADELCRYCSFQFPPYVGIFHASVDLTLDIIQSYSWRLAEVEKPWWKKTIAIKQREPEYRILDYTRSRYSFVETEHMLCLPYRKFVSPRSRLTIFLLTDETHEDINIILTTVSEEVEMHLASGVHEFFHKFPLAMAP